MHTCACACKCVCNFISVWPFKRFLRGRGGREDNGSRHYLLLSCRLSIRPHTQWPSQTQTPSGCTCTHAPTRRTNAPNTYLHTHGLVEGQPACTQSPISTCWHILHRKSLKPTHPHTHTDAQWAHTLPFFLKEVSYWGRTGRVLHVLARSFPRQKIDGWLEQGHRRRNVTVWLQTCRCGLCLYLCAPLCTYIRGCSSVCFCSFFCMQTCMLLLLYTATVFILHCVRMHLCIYAFMFIPHVWVCVGGGGKHPGSTLSQAASRQAGLSHGPPGEGCLLWARAVMIVPAGGIAHAH